ncbi:MAG TPA: hypothetical protein VJH94_02760 [Candidatus Paceibacterota bacterium]
MNITRPHFKQSAEFLSSKLAVHQWARGIRYLSRKQIREEKEFLGEETFQKIVAEAKKYRSRRLGRRAPGSFGTGKRR